MPDHLHLFARFAPDALALSDWMKALKGTLAKVWREQGCSGGLRPPVVNGERCGGQRAPLQAYWQKGFFDHVIRSEESYSEKWRYVAENPVRKHLVARAEEWPYAGEVHVLRAEGE